MQPQAALVVAVLGYRAESETALGHGPMQLGSAGDEHRPSLAVTPSVDAPGLARDAPRAAVVAPQGSVPSAQGGEEPELGKRGLPATMSNEKGPVRRSGASYLR